MIPPLIYRCILFSLGIPALVLCGLASAPGAQAAAPAPKPSAGHQRVDFLTPHPPYPLEAKITRIDGDVVVRVTWAADGSVREAVVVKSSGSDLLDGPTRKYIEAHWRCLTGEEVTRTVTLRYVLHHYPQPVSRRR